MIFEVTVNRSDSMNVFIGEMFTNVTGQKLNTILCHFWVKLHSHHIEENKDVFDPLEESKTEGFH